MTINIDESMKTGIEQQLKHLSSHKKHVIYEIIIFKILLIGPWFRGAGNNAENSVFFFFSSMKEIGFNEKAI